MSEKREKSFPAMVASLIEDMIALVRGHIELAKTEIRDAVNSVLTSTVYFIVALMVGWFALLFLLVACALGINAAGLPLWASFLIMTVVMGILIGILVWRGVRRLKKMRSSRLSFESLNKTAEMFRDFN